MRRVVVPFVLVTLVTLGLGGCGPDSTVTADPVDGPNGRTAPTHGTVPAASNSDEAVSVTRCTMRAGTLRVVALITNQTGELRESMPLSVRVRDENGIELRPEWAKSVGGIGVPTAPGSTMRAVGTFDLGGDAADVTCELEGDPFPFRVDLLDTVLDVRDVALTGCGEGGDVVLTNPTDEEVGVEVLVETYDRAGHALGGERYRAGPAETSGGGVRPGPGAAAEIRIGMHDGSTPIAGCRAVAASLTTDPETAQIIQD